MNSGSPGRSFIFKKSSRITVVTAVTIAVLVLSGLDDLRVAVVTHRSDSATAVSYTHLTLPTSDLV